MAATSPRRGCARASLSIAAWAASTAAGAASFTVTDPGDNGGIDPAPFAGTGTLRQAIVDQFASGAGVHTITIAPTIGTIQLQGDLPAFTVAGSQVTLVGNGRVLSGGNQFRGLFLYAGTLIVDDLVIANTVAKGGNGGNLAGGGGGFGGGLFVNRGASAVLGNVFFVSNAAVGGDAGTADTAAAYGGGGGMGGNGSPLAGGGGGVGRGATGGGPAPAARGILLGAAPGGSSVNGLYPGGANGGGGGRSGEGANLGWGGAGGGVGGRPGTNLANFTTQFDAAGGFGGGGGAFAGHGGFGGGGGGSLFGSGGFGGGAGWGTLIFDNATEPGWGGGFGGRDICATPGAGLGGAIFVTEGGSLSIFGPFGQSLGTAQGGAWQGCNQPAPAVGAGAAVFAQGTNTIGFAPAAGQYQSINDEIADQTGTLPVMPLDVNPTRWGGPDCTPGAVPPCAQYALQGSLGLAKFSQGTLELRGTSTFTGPVTVNAGVLAMYGSLVPRTLVVSDIPYTAAPPLVTVKSTATLEGLGNAGRVAVEAGGTLAPGIASDRFGASTRGVLTVRQAALAPGAVFRVRIDGGTRGSGYDALDVQGPVSVGDATLSVLPNLLPPIGSTLLVIDNDGSDPITGTFAGVPEGGLVNGGTLRLLRVSYVGGTGNDLTLAVLGAPDAPGGLVVARGNGEARISWTTPAGSGGLPITGYRVQARLQPAGTFVDAAGCPANGVALSCTATGLTPGSAYVFRVAATNAAGTGGFSPTSAPITIGASPSVTTTASPVVFFAVGPAPRTPLPIDTGIVVADPDNTTLARARIAITGGLVASEDVLGFIGSAATGNIIGSYDAPAGVLTLQSAGATATLAQWQAALRSVSYTNGAATPTQGDRTMTFTAEDDLGPSTPATRTVRVLRDVLLLDGFETP